MTPDQRARIAQALPSYEIGAELGRGAFGVVLGGRHRQLGREVAIKQLPAGFSADPEVRSRFLAEAQILAALDHAHVVPVYDYVEFGDLCLLVMEKLTGGTLWSRFTGQGLTPQASCATLLAACAGLDHAHRHGVLHRDIKPENLLFGRDGVLKVADFGIAKMLTGSQAMATRAGDVLGTPAYMAPEQALGQTVGPPADVYACGVMLYELLSGRLPFSEEGGALAIVYRHVNEDPTPITDVTPTVSAPIAEVVMTALARDPAQRFGSAEEFAVELGGAATATWQPGWLELADLPVTASRPVMDSTMRPSGRMGSTAAWPSGAAQTGGAPPAAGGPPVRPRVSHHVQGGGDDLDVHQLIPVREAIQPGPFPWLALVVALAAVLAATGLVLAGPAASWDDRPAPGVLQIAGVDPATGQVPTVALGEELTVDLGPRAPQADSIEIDLSVLDLPLAATGRSAVEGTDGARSARLQLGSARFTAAGMVAADVRLLAGDVEVEAYRFPLRSDQSAFLTVPGVLIVGLVLFCLAYAESFLRHLRRGRRRVTAVLGVMLAGAGLAVGLVGIAWLVGGRQPLLPAAATVAVLGAVAGLAAGIAARRTGRRRRLLVRLA